MSAEDQQLYIDGFSALTAASIGGEGFIQTLSQDHYDQFDGDAHEGSYFFPWHREMLYRLESEIRNLGGDYSCFSLPYWDSSVDQWWDAMDGGEDGSMGGPVQGHQCISEGPLSATEYSPAGSDCLRRNVQFGISLPSSSLLMNNIDQRDAFSAFRVILEKDHGAAHVGIDGNMGGEYSPDDPMFYLHHSFWDYLWALWQQCKGFDGQTHPSNSDLFDGDVDYEMAVGGSPFTAADTFDIANMYGDGYIYEKGPFWTNANVDEIEGCLSSNGEAWFVDSGAQRTENPDKAREDAAWNDCASKFSEEIEVRNCWTTALCEHDQVTEKRICVEPEHFENCLGMDVDAISGDIDISLDELLSKEGLTDCMKTTRKLYYDWAKLTRSLMALCNGCYDSFCGRSSKLEDTCASSTEASHWIAAGNPANSKWDGIPNVQCAADSNVEASRGTESGTDIAVSCCARDGSAVRQFDGAGDCRQAKTYHEAEAICNGYGHRLCTLAEMLDKTTKGAGCGHDERYNWVADECGGDTAHFVVQGRTSWSGWGSAPDHYCQSDDNNQAAYHSNKMARNIGVGCCSMDGTSGDRPHCVNPATFEEAEALCLSKNMRLCTRRELLDGITEGTGCSFDRAYQWATDQCAVGVDAAVLTVSAHHDVDVAHSGRSLGDYSATALGAVVGMALVLFAVAFAVVMAKRKRTQSENTENTQNKEHVPESSVVSDVGLDIDGAESSRTGTGTQ